MLSRITPAYAGKSCRFHFQSFASWDHPRLCGEKPLLKLKHPYAKRITPAYAGKSQGDAGRICKDRDHPRLCGEKQSSGSVGRR